MLLRWHKDSGQTTTISFTGSPWCWVLRSGNQSWGFVWHYHGEWRASFRGRNGLLVRAETAKEARRAVWDETMRAMELDAARRLGHHRGR